MYLSQRVLVTPLFRFTSAILLSWRVGNAVPDDPR